MEARERVKLIEDNISKVIVGRSEVIHLVVSALVAGGHVLLEDVPGTGKTMLARALAKSMDMDFARIQFTPDLLPSDITGLNIFNPEEGAFVFRKGPVFTNILLADEINRATPRTQSGLLECMEEKQVTVDGVTMELPLPFFVIATQNPIETAGTFPLPEAQMDRFIVRLSMGLPDKEEEAGILRRVLHSNELSARMESNISAPGNSGGRSGRVIKDERARVRTDGESLLRQIEAVANADDIVEARREAALVRIAPPIVSYLVDVVTGTRKRKDLVFGSSPRGTLSLAKMTQVLAYLDGRDYVVPEDIKEAAPACLAHRLRAAHMYGVSVDTGKIVEEILDEIPVPTEDFT